MTDTITRSDVGIRTAAAARRAAYTSDGQVGHTTAAIDAPCDPARMVTFPAQLRVAPKQVKKNGADMYRLEGYATTFGKWYEMYDMFGSYKERVNKNALDDTLAAGPDVMFLVNHTGLMMARTTTGTLELSADDHGLRTVAYLNSGRADVQILMSAVTDGLVDEMSFAFMLDQGLWNDDFTEFEITRADIDRGDVSAVNYGANPFTSIAARSRELITRELDRLPTGAARAAVARLMDRDDMKAGPQMRAALDAASSTITQAMAWFTAIDSIVDEAQEALAAALGVPNPDPDEGTPEQLAAGERETREQSQPTSAADEVLPPAAVMDGRSLDATAAWLAVIEAEKIGPRP